MRNRMKRRRRATIGLRAKTGRAIFVVLSDAGDGAEHPQVLTKGELRLTDPKVPATFQPYHEVLDLPWERAKIAVRKTASIIEATATSSLSSLLRQLISDDFEVCGVGIVGAGDRNLEAIGGPHIRAHAAEGLLFRQMLDAAADTNKLYRRTFPERDLSEIAVSELGQRIEWLKQHLDEIGRNAERPWRADEKSAALAAWLTLASVHKKKER